MPAKGLEMVRAKAAEKVSVQGMARAMVLAM